MTTKLLLYFQGAGDVTVVVEDYSANGVGELSVSRGQQVEVVEAAAPVGHTQTPGDWCLIRTMPPDGADPSQGLVPLSVLKPIAVLKGPGARNSVDLDGKNLVIVGQRINTGAKEPSIFCELKFCNFSFLTPSPLVAW